MWKTIKAELLEIGSAKIEGEPADEFIAKSSAGPGLGGNGSVFFELNGKRVRLGISETSPVTIYHRENGSAVLCVSDKKIEGRLEKPGQHCPKQAFITITPSCIYNCRYCSVSKKKLPSKTVDEICGLIENAGDISAISLTSGVENSAEFEELKTIEILKKLKKYNLPIGVSIYPVFGTAKRLASAGASEIKFNLETATESLFNTLCPNMDRKIIDRELDEAVQILGRGHVFTNLIIGVGETDEEVAEFLENISKRGIIVSLRPLNPGSQMKNFSRPTHERMLSLFSLHTEIMKKYELDTAKAQTMCIACTGCDLVPFRDAD
ncbi:MAG: radical SAM protein [Methanocorpusculum sp.]|nr:radical SAM protein [Methanocorpusculum sp.]